jgi:hypothetical protein
MTISECGNHILELVGVAEFPAMALGVFFSLFFGPFSPNNS